MLALLRRPVPGSATAPSTLQHLTLDEPQQRAVTDENGGKRMTLLAVKLGTEGSSSLYPARITLTLGMYFL